MTNKQRNFARALAEGHPLEQAAEEAGYNLAYARRKQNEPATRALVERYFNQHLKALERATEGRTEGEADEAELNRRPDVYLMEMINDPGTEPAQKVSAIRALIAYQRNNRQERPVPIILDDIAMILEHCHGCIYQQAGTQCIKQLTGKD